ncbi:MAG: hypothetical protein ACE5KE_00695 [Methanosarcinales archaeon]
MRKRLNLKLLDEIAIKIGWEIIEKGAVRRVYVRDRLKIKLTKVVKGYKIMLFRNNKMVDADITSSKHEALILLGESLMFREW